MGTGIYFHTFHRDIECYSFELHSFRMVVGTTLMFELQSFLK